ncbi:hypothetical protein [Rhizobium metallidurans]|uniref:Uncharacterized protein n=1 Tax=Rhizobium metallidurans TaxID=1265931 RepID=A0A7W6GDR1_9HYPH|nr:hypothetical protein [Rhizobium metallidurans]MBB3967330.1 hypothetical protein [Rhizobium metallidurans]
MNFDRLWADYARYLPAPNENFVKFAEQSSSTALKSRLPTGVLARHLNFLKPSSPLFSWPDILFTATFAVDKTADTIITRRDRQTSFVLGDSGGFSMISGAIKHSMASWREATLRWQERDCDVGIIVDVPTRAIEVPASGFKSFQQCLDQTIRNAEFAINARSRSDLKLLAVYQGRTKAEADRWADVMQRYQLQFEGMAIAGHTRLNIHEWVPRLIGMIERGTFETVRHIHFLGTAQPKFAVLATALQRALRRHVRTDINVTFDSSTSFTFVQKYGQITTGLDAGSFRMTEHIMPSRPADFEPSAPFPYRGPLADRCRLGDFMPGTDPAKNPADSVGNNMLSHHSVYAELSAILQANRLVDMAQAGKNSLVPHGIALAVDRIDRAFACDGKAVADLQGIFRKPENTMVAVSTDRADDFQPTGV